MKIGLLFAYLVRAELDMELIEDELLRGFLLWTVIFMKSLLCSLKDGNKKLE